jgi:Flp pilus assembly protein TadD
MVECMQGRPWREWLLTSLALTLLTFAVFGSSLDNGWIHMDSRTHIQMGANRSVAEVWSEADYFSWYPLTLLTFRLEHAFVGMEPFLYHLDNVILHALVSILVVVFARALLGAPGFVVPFACGALFAVHPLHVESVAWIAERKDLLSVGFYLLSLIAWLRYCDRGGRGAYAAALAWLGLALLSKSMAVTAPVVMLAIDALRGRRPWLRVLAEKIPFVAISVLTALVNLRAQSPYRSVAMDRRALWYDDFGLVERLGTGLDSLVFYTAKSLVPVRLAGWYEIDAVQVAALDWGLALAGFGLLALAFWRMPGIRGALAFGVFFFLVTLAPVAKVMPFGGDSVYNDRYMYLPSIGLFLALALPLRGLASWGAAPRALAVAGLVAMTGALIWQARARAEVYFSAETFWSDVVAKYPESSGALNSLGEHRKDREGDVEGALPLFYQAAALRPELGRSFYNIGAALERQGDLAGAETQLLRSMELSPMEPSYLFGTAGFYTRHDRPRDVVALFERATERWPDQPRAWFRLGQAYLGLGQEGRARGAFAEVLRLDPDHGAAHLRLAAIYHNQRHRPKALHHLERAAESGVQVDPGLARRIRGSAGGGKSG